MQPTEIQVACSLAALLDPHDAASKDLGEPRPPATIPSGLLDDLGSASLIRPERLAEVVARLASGDKPSDDDLASRMVGRLVCDRLR